MNTKEARSGHPLCWCDACGRAVFAHGQTLCDACRLGPDHCGHSACRQYWIDTGSKECVETGFAADDDFEAGFGGGT